MAAGHHGRAFGVASLAAREDVAGLVHPYGAARLLAPAHEEIPAVPVEIGEGETTHPALLGGADLRKLHEAFPQSRAVNLEVVHT